MPLVDSSVEFLGGLLQSSLKLKLNRGIYERVFNKLDVGNILHASSGIPIRIGPVFRGILCILEHIPSINSHRECRLDSLQNFSGGWDFCRILIRTW